MRIPADLLPQKAVAEDLGVSRITLWRARNSGLEGFPEPVFVRNLVFWKKTDVETLQKAMGGYRGRVVFEKTRRAEAALKRTSKGSREVRQARADQESQPDLFD